MPCVYILLTRTDTLFARLLHGLGKHRYTHASLALDRDLGRLYSFARRYEPFMLPGGFIRENIHAGVFGRCGGADSLLLELPVSRATYEAIERQMTVMASAGSCWDYDVLEGCSRVAHISKQLLSWGDTYVIEFSNPADELMCLLLVIAIDAANCGK